jgi:cytochrome c biogenesis protein CcdA
MNAKSLSLPLFLTTLPCVAATPIAIGGLLSTVVYLIIIGLIFWCVWWFLGYVGVPEPFNKVLRVVIGLVALLVVINVLLGLTGSPLVTWR